MEWIVIGLSACLTSALTLFSGFGLGTLLLPAFAFFFPLELAVAMTAIVHLFNNGFKLFLVGRRADFRTVLQFGGPAVVAAFVGAGLLVWLTDIPPLATWELAGRTLKVSSLNLCLAALMAGFAILEMWPTFSSWSVPRKFLPLGGLLSGFFGGLSGHQGALRSVFLLRAGLSKETFIGTGVVIACLVDISRLSLYARKMSTSLTGKDIPLLLFAMGMAWMGAFVGSRLLHKVTLRKVQIIVAVLLLLIAIMLGTGWI